MAYLIPMSLFCLVVILPNFLGHGAFRPFWRKPTNTPTPTLLPPIDKDPDFYEELRKIPPKNETAKKIITNILRIQPGGKRSLKSEDIVIVMDGSGSVGSCEFDNGKKAMKNLMEFEQPGFDTKYAMVTFATNSRIDFNFIPQLYGPGNISSVGFPSGLTNTQAGLAHALDLFSTGSRGLSRKLVMLLTDGQSNIEKEKTIPNAQKLKDQGVDVFVIAVGGQHVQGIDEMARIASFPPADFLFRVNKNGDFLDVVNLAIKEVAPDQYKILDTYVPTCSG